MIHENCVSLTAVTVTIKIQLYNNNFDIMHIRLSQ